MRKTAFLLLLAIAPAASAAYKCIDEKGKTIFGDTPPDACANVVLYEISRTGTVLRKIDPTPTPEQVKAREEEAKRKREEEKIAAEQNRRDTALLTSFSAESEFDSARDRSVAPLQSRIRIAQERIKVLDKRLAQIDDEMEFYKAGKSKAAKKEHEIPHALLAEQERLRNEKQTLVANIATFDKEMGAQRSKFDADKRRWVELKTGMAAKADAPKKAGR